MSAEKYDDTLLPFLALMRKELHANASKGDRPGWLKMSADTALLEIYWHTAKLSAAVKNNDGPAITEHSADVANMAMMLLDVCGGIPTPSPQAAQQAPAGASRFADVLAIQRREAECTPSDAYMVGLYNGMSMMDANYCGRTDWEPMSVAQAAPALHPKTADLVQRFSAALTEKLASAEKKYGYSDGWASPDWVDECRLQLREHLFKGDPRDVAAYCAFLWHHGASTALPAEVIEELAAEVTRLFPAPTPVAPAAPSTPASGGWISVDERLPPSARPVLACNPCGFIGRAEFSSGRWNHIGRPSHWMPLPPLPASPTIEGESNG